MQLQFKRGYNSKNIFCGLNLQLHFERGYNSCASVNPTQECKLLSFWQTRQALARKRHKKMSSTTRKLSFLRKTPVPPERDQVSRGRRTAKSKKGLSSQYFNGFQGNGNTAEVLSAGLQNGVYGKSPAQRE